ncbi:C40 family peptidase [Rudaeicoccus suwonensis]|uniref:C40 family peptidase n=1 Tax=Rudaeicoccus suwonensis TaxID=657409 RepID=UPI0014774FCD|nr:NlpC/P60 family protein [Rudaeicoccus suwonensis]
MSPTTEPSKGNGNIVNLPGTATIRVPVAGVWARTTSPRPIDAAIVADDADHEQWLRDLDGVALEDGRLGLLDRFETEALEGEPVVVRSHTADGWSQVVCPWQPSSKDAEGYPGFIRTAHLDAGGATRARPSAGGAVTRTDLLAEARRYVGLAYLWGGISADGLDCSGLVHFSCRNLGLTVARDCDDQHEIDCEPVELGTTEPGDLLFFARPAERIHHVAIAAGGDTILHSPSTGHRIVEESMPETRRRTLVAAGRLRCLQ